MKIIGPGVTPTHGHFLRHRLRHDHCRHQQRPHRRRLVVFRPTAFTLPKVLLVEVTAVITAVVVAIVAIVVIGCYAQSSPCLRRRRFSRHEFSAMTAARLPVPRLALLALHTRM
jgi:hypothetical protein